MKQSKRSAHELFHEWKRKGVIPKRRHTAIKKVAEFIGLSEKFFKGLCPDKSMNLAGESRIDDRLAFLYWDIEENGGRLCAPSREKKDKAYVLWLLDSARVIITGVRESAKVVGVADGGDTAVNTVRFNRAYTLPNEGYVQTAKMRPGQLSGLARARLNVLERSLENWKLANSAPELVLAAINSVEEMMKRWRNDIYPDATTYDPAYNEAELVSVS